MEYLIVYLKFCSHVLCTNFFLLWEVIIFFFVNSLIPFNEISLFGKHIFEIKNEKIEREMSKKLSLIVLPNLRDFYYSKSILNHIDKIHLKLGYEEFALWGQKNVKFKFNVYFKKEWFRAYYFPGEKTICCTLYDKFELKYFYWYNQSCGIPYQVFGSISTFDWWWILLLLLLQN